MKAQPPIFRISYEGVAAPPDELPRDFILIGSDETECDIKLDKLSTVSSKHAAVRWREGRFYLTDIDEANDTLLNQRLLLYDDEEALADGDISQIGPYLFEFEWEAGTPELSIKVTRLILKSTFDIKRTDLRGDVRIEGEGLSIGSHTDCQLVLNNLNVSPLHAGINRIRDRFDPSRSCFYLTDLTYSNSTLLDDLLLLTNVPGPINNGSLARIGPYLLTFCVEDATLNINVEFTPTTNPGTVADKQDKPASQPSATDAQADAKDETKDEAKDEIKVAELARAGGGDDEQGRVTTTDALKIFWSKRTRAKAARTSPLHPKPIERPGRARFAWRPTSDLAGQRSVVLVFWVLLLVGLSVWLAARSFPVAFEPRPLSDAHARASMKGPLLVATKSAANDCASCHAPAATMNEACASCHRSESFNAAATAEHQAAGVGCIACHAEHRGAGFRPGLQPLSASFQPGVENEETCAGCHSDANKKTYNGKSVSTPHGGTFGYPLVGDKWVWRGLPQQEWESKPAEMRRQLALLEQAAQRWPVAGNAAERRRSAEFHTLHVYRLPVAGQVKGDKKGMLDCTSCHTGTAPVDRKTPRETCAACHNGCTDAATRLALIAPDRPNCTSCHVQHVRGARAPVAPCGLVGGRA